MQGDTDFPKLVEAMFHDTREWRDLDQQIRTMNKKLAQWRKARLDYGTTYRLTHRTAVELWVTMQVIYGIVEKSRTSPPAVEPPATLSPGVPLDELSPDVACLTTDGAVVTGAFDYIAHETIAAPDNAVASTVLDAAA